MNEYTPMPIRTAATCYLAAGLSVLPALPAQKRPSIQSWSPFQSHLPSSAELDSWLESAQGLCIVCGAVSGNLEMIDFDLGGAMFDAWKELVQELAPGLLERLVIESTPSGGFHAVYRSESEICGNTKLASRNFEADDDSPITVGAKDYKPRRMPDGSWAATVVMIETRGEGGLFLCAPSPNYSIVQGDLAKPPTITASERNTLLSAAWSLDESGPKEVVGSAPNEVVSVLSVSESAPTGNGYRFTNADLGLDDHGKQKPGEAFNQSGDPRPYLERAGWVCVRGGDNEHWRRPGKDKGSSATLKDGVFYVFSSSAAPFEPGKGYSPFAVFALLEHGGDFEASARALGQAGWGGQPAGQAGWGGQPAGHTIDSFQTQAASNSGGVDLTPYLGNQPSQPADSDFEIIDSCEIVHRFPSLRRPVIHGLLRQGETMNIIAAPKSHKSWLSMDMALSLALGQPWLGRFPTEQGRVLIIDNELHHETTAHRMPQISKARGIPEQARAGMIDIVNVRGRLKDINRLSEQFAKMPANRYKMIILDAFYRFMPSGADENDNAGMAAIYNTLDAYAHHLGCSFVLIHHSSKGNQSGKSVTDMGAGAGSQSRAADAHVALRPHEEDGVSVLDAVVRSWPPPDPFCVRWEFPVWNIDEDLDPSDLEGKVKPKSNGEPKSPARNWTAAEFVDRYVNDEPATKDELWKRAKGEPGLNRDTVRTLVAGALQLNLIEQVSKAGSGRGGGRGYVRVRKENLYDSLM